MNANPRPLFLLALAVISLIGSLAVHMYMPMIPAVKAALGLTETTAQLTFSIALFGMAISTLFYGSLSDRYGRRPVLLMGLALFLIGSAICTVTDTLVPLVAGRFIQAIGAGAGLTLSRAIARDVYGRERLVKAIAYLTMAYTLGPMIAPSVGGVLIDLFGWRSVFVLALATGCLILLLAYTIVHETRAPTPENRTEGTVLKNYIALFRHMRFSAFVLQSGFMTATFMVAATAAANLLKDVLQRPSTEFGLYFLLFPFGYLLGNFITTRIGNRGAIETMVLAGALVTLAGTVVESGFLLGGYVTVLVLFAPGFLIAMGQGLSLPYAQSAAMTIDPKLAGTAAGIGVFMQHFLGAVFTQIYGLLGDGTPGPLIVTSMICAILALVTALVPFLMVRSGKIKSSR